MARKQRPLDRILSARQSLDFAIRFPEQFPAEKLREMLPEWEYAMRQLMDFRNIVNAVAALDDEPAQSVSMFADA